MDIDRLVFLVFSILVFLDFSLGGKEILRAARETERKDLKPFVTGIGYLTLTVAVFQGLWLLVIFTGIAREEIMRHVVVGFFVLVDMAAIISRRLWWRRATNVKKW